MEEKASLLIIFMISHLSDSFMIFHFLITGNCLFSQIRCKVKTFSTISSINSQKLLLFAANLSFLLTFLQEYAENWRKIVAIAFGSSKEECKHPHKKHQKISPWIATFHRSFH